MMHIYEFLMNLHSEKPNHAARAITPSDEEPEEENASKITYTVAIFSCAELAKAQRQREPVAQLLVLPSNLGYSNRL